MKLDNQPLEKIIREDLDNKNKEAFREHFIKVHPSDQVDIFVTLNDEERKRLYTYLSPKEFAVIFAELYFIDQQSSYKELPLDYFSLVLDSMFTDNVVSFLNRIDEDDKNRLLNQMDSEKAQYVTLLLSQNIHTAGSIMTGEFITTRKNNTVRETLDIVKTKEEHSEIAYYIYVVDDDKKLEGIISLKKLVTMNENDKIESGMITHIVTVSPEDKNIEVGKVIQKYDLLGVPVVTEDNHMIGVITVDDVMDVIETHKIKEFGQFSTVKDADETEGNAFYNAKKRAPWIIFLMFAGLVTGSVIGKFEDTLESVVVLATFMPMLMDSGGNVGTQSLAVSVRELALGRMDMKHFWKRLFRELTTGFIIGFACMILIILLILVLFQNLALSLVVGVSILLTLTISAVIGLVFPLILEKLNFDPAIASGPFITTINDITGLIIYFSIATTFMQYI